jgi:hypothetical protein
MGAYFKESKEMIGGNMMELRAKRRRVVKSFGIFCSHCNGISPILMYKYVKGFWVERLGISKGLICENLLVLFGVS